VREYVCARVCRASQRFVVRCNVTALLNQNISVWTVSKWKSISSTKLKTYRYASARVCVLACVRLCVCARASVRV